MAKRIEMVIYILPIFLVIVTALLDLGLALGLALAFVIGYVLYHTAQRRGWRDLVDAMTRDQSRRSAK
ncbi:MAG: hypothetical protein M5R40_02250 [Anaerolineae bacterium]|nr:hypothetical protein [Anaerolineae bacterium]